MNHSASIPSASYVNKQELNCQANLQQQAQIEEIRKSIFQDAAANLMHLYKEGIKCSEESYYQGKEDAYEEVLKWFLSYNNGSNFKHVSVNEFFNFITQRLQEHRTSGKRSKQSQSSSQSNQNFQQQRSGVQPMTMSNLTQGFGGQANSLTNGNQIYNNQSSFMRAQSFYQQNQLNQNVPGGAHCDNQLFSINSAATYTKDDLLDLLAMQAQVEALQQDLNISNKININLGNIKVSDSKKRRRQNFYAPSQNENRNNQMDDYSIRNNDNDLFQRYDNDEMFNENHNPLKFRANNDLEKRYYTSQSEKDEWIYLNNGYQNDTRSVFNEGNGVANPCSTGCPTSFQSQNAVQNNLNQNGNSRSIEGHESQQQPPQQQTYLLQPHQATKFVQI